jgi:hypothetical protein
MRKSVSLSGIAGDARADHVLPCCLSAAVSRQDVIDVQVGSLEVVSAILAGVFITLEDIVVFPR